MEHTNSENSKFKNNIELAQLFEVEELEDRVEFGKWSGSVKGGTSEEQGPYVEGKVTYTF